MDPRLFIGVMAAVLFLVVLWGLHQYRAYARPRGLGLILWTAMAFVFIDVVLRYKLYVAGASFAAAFALAYVVGWRWFGGNSTGWKRHVIRAVAFALCLGPLAGVPGFLLPDLVHWLRMLGRLPAEASLSTVIYGLPGLWLVGAVAFAVSTGEAALTEGRLPARGLKWGSAAVLVSLGPLLTWYAVGLFVPRILAAGDTHLVHYALVIRPGFVHMRGSGGQTPLHVAVFARRTQTVRLLLAAGAPVNVKDNDETTALHVAAEHCDAHMVQALLTAGADAKAKEESGLTALLIAADNLDAGVTKVLMDAGANLADRDRYGRTPLHRATAVGHAETAGALLGGGADANARDCDGQTPMHKAVDAYGRIDTAKALLVAGACINARDKGGKTALDVALAALTHAQGAAQRNHLTAVIALLEAAGGKTGGELPDEAPHSVEVPVQPEPGR